MLKSFVLKPTQDILSYIDHKEYPFILFPTIVLIYGRRIITKLDGKDLSVLYHIGYNNNDVKRNSFKINFHCLANPTNLLLEESENYNKLNKTKFDNIKNILNKSFPKDVSNIIVNIANSEKIEWELVKQRTCRNSKLLVDTFTMTNETKIPFSMIHKCKNKYYPSKELLSIDRVIQAEFIDDSYLPFNINVKYFNKQMKKGSFTINNKGVNNKIIKTRLLIFFKENKNRHYNSNDDSDYETEDLCFERNIGNFQNMSLT